MSTELTAAVRNLGAVNALDEVAKGIITLMQDRASRPSQGEFTLGYVMGLKDAIDLIHAKAKEKVSV